MQSDLSLTSNQDLPGDLETRDKATPPPSSPGILEHVLLTRDSPEDLDTKLLLCNDESFPDYPASALVHPPCYRTSHVFTSPSSLAASHTSTETEESFSEGRVNTKQDEKTTPSSLELDKRALSSTTDEEPPAHQLLRDSSSELCLSKISLPSGLLGLNQPFSSSGYFPSYRTEGELCIGPALGDRFFTEKEGLENKEEGQEEETSIWSLNASCLVC